MQAALPAIPFNKPYLSGPEARYIEEAVRSGKISGDGLFTRRCHQFFEQQLGFAKVLLTTSCTHALEMAALLLDLQPGDEVIMPSYTFVSTANAFVLRGANIVFADSTAENPNLDTAALESLITPRTRAIVPVHYAGIACDMDAIQALANRQGLTVVEDAAQAIDSFYKGRGIGYAWGAGGFLVSRNQEHHFRRGRPAGHQRPALRAAGRNHPRERHQPLVVFPGRGG